MSKTKMYLLVRELWQAAQGHGVVSGDASRAKMMRILEEALAGGK